MKLALLSCFLLVQLTLLAQSPEPAQIAQIERIDLTNSVDLHTAQVASTLPIESLLTAPEAPADSIASKRHFLTTGLYMNGKRLSTSSVLYTYQKAPKSMPKSLNLYQLGSFLKPVGPLMVVTGVYIGYLAIKGKPATAMVRGTGGTYLNPVVPDVPAEYTVRNLPRLLAGIGMVIGGIAVIEFSNELVAKSAKNYNSKLSRPRRVAILNNAKFGITPDGNIGLYARF
ncbi:hypothetical protein IC229_08705 [Spirosoma sp. BT702]|uniref:DUF5683 domain-containing protein n=1 Tax=Spirosoma profusum TaxID=2771354 RepID=A0A926XUI7_9BACT|nr:hypothetical protein [Spirosoma profusum]MBD2700714.1 hypothetical protein [Spirosoma profusum]